MKDHKVLSTLEEIKAISDPYRLKIITTFRRFKRAATVKEIADKLNETPAKVHYHVKKLEKVNILKLVDTKEINGIIAKYYRPTFDKFIIKHTENDKELSKIMLGETQRAIFNIYEDSKEIIFNEIANADLPKITNDDDDDVVESISSSTVYLTKKDLDEFAKLIHKFCDKDKEDKDTQKYHFFNVLFPIDDDK